MPPLDGLSLRPATPLDLKLICAFPQSPEELYYLYPKARWPLTFEQLAAVAQQRVDPTVAALGRRPVGYANAQILAQESALIVGNVVVAPALRGRGIATLLLDHFAGLARDKYRLRMVRVSCFARNEGALLLYARLGFKPFEIESRPGPDGAALALVKLARRV